MCLYCTDRQNHGNMMTMTDNNKKLSAELNRTVQHVSTVLQLLHTNVTQLRAEVRNRSFFTGVTTIRCVLISIDKTSRVFTTLKRYSGNQQYSFSERELMFMFAICRRPSVCLSVVCL